MGTSKGQHVKHLDSEYRGRWINFHLSDGTIEDSRTKNWRDVKWNNVVKISVHILDKIHEVDNSGKNFFTFMNFRWGGQEAIYKKEKYVGHKPIKIWTIGWSDGYCCYLKDIDFYTGQFIKDYNRPLCEFKAHIHPDILNKKGI